VRFRLRAPATVVFTVLGPSPNCGVAGRKFVRGRRGMNKVRLNGRFGDHRLAPGTYVIVVDALRGESHKRVGKISIQVVPPGSHVRRPGSAPVFRCSGPAAQTGIPGAGLFVSPPDQISGPLVQRVVAKTKPTSRSGVLADPPFHLGIASNGWDMALALILYGTLGLGGAVLLVYLVRFFRGHERF
jgi:hypothetical protein